MVTRGWVGEEDLSEEAVEARRQEALKQYGDQIAALKQQEIQLNENISNLKQVIEDANTARMQELQSLDDSLKAKMSNVEDLAIKGKSLNVEYEQKLSALALETSVFEAYRKEKEAEIESRLADIEKKEVELTGEVSAHEVAVSEHSIRVNDHNLSIEDFNKEIALIDAKKAEAAQLLNDALKQADSLSAAREACEIAHKNALDAKVVYEARTTSIESEREGFASLKSELDARAAKLNEEKSRQTEQAIQLKIDRAAYEKSMEELNKKQAEASIQINKLEELKSQIKES